ncbi:hypothetical protein DDZ13_11100 [Coraliomargarita sinensis]|uniref:Pectate lyase superfamily protein domain-containing protein n=1 Tax=Coraliomargarita sinensis TaxID=2174842 RepID=A0A317ZH21_9BACT|nr:right-handed parallel beta-helix repeat-containing protein [Coraliomargarita sinensis]PXA03523.1 hypothetical protein DDZ13_11100 [Coraliomargarita sinensis]
MIHLFTPSILLSLCIALGPLVLVAEPPAETTVYQAAEKKRAHLEDCRRYQRMSDEAQAKMVAMTFAQAKAKGLPLCSRCPGSTTPGKGNPEDGGLESWVNPAPDEIREAPFKASPYAPLVATGPNGALAYDSYSEKGDRLLDWSKCGYKMSNEPLPDVQVLKTLEPLSGKVTREGSMAYPMGPDSQKRIQDALNTIAQRSADGNGLKGALLLSQGTYYLSGGLHVPSGVVLRGEGSGENGTVLICQSDSGRGDAISIGSGEGIDHVGESDSVRIRDDYVPSASYSVNVTDADQFNAGDFVCVRKTVNRRWIDDLGMGERLRHIRGGKEGLKKRPWKPESYQFRHIRQIARIQGDAITFEVMLPQSFAKVHGGGEVFKVSVDPLASQSGVEHLRIVSNYDTSVKDTGKQANFKNFRNGISVSSAMHSWVRDCTVLHVSFAAVKVADHTMHVTVRDCNFLEPVGPKRGGNYYAFSIAGGTGHLFYNCYAEDARHCFAGGSRNMGPYVFFNCTSVRGGQSEPHHRWGTGFLYDNVTTEDGSLAAINRGDSGSGHGWAAANTLFWNCDARNIVVMDPETEGENNFAIGFTGDPQREHGTKGLMYANNRAGYWGTPREGKYYGFPVMGSGHIESPTAPVEPRSLFVRQLIERIGEERAKAVLK